MLASKWLRAAALAAAAADIWALRLAAEWLAAAEAAAAALAAAAARADASAAALAADRMGRIVLGRSDRLRVEIRRGA